MIPEMLLTERLWYIAKNIKNNPPYIFDNQYFNVYTDYELAKQDFEELISFSSDENNLSLLEIEDNASFFKRMRQAHYLRYTINGEGDVLELTPKIHERIATQLEEPAVTQLEEPVVTQLEEPVVPLVNEPVAQTVEKPVVPITKEKQNRPVFATFSFFFCGFLAFAAFGGFLSGDFALAFVVSAASALYLILGICFSKCYIKAPIAAYLIIFWLFFFFFVLFSPDISNEGNFIFLIFSIIHAIYFIIRNRNLFKKTEK